METLKLANHGQIAINTHSEDDKYLLHVLHRTWKSPFKTRSVVARENPEVIAQLAYWGLITTQNVDLTFGSVWRITSRGLALLEHYGDLYEIP
jgi:hypothetical protein